MTREEWDNLGIGDIIWRTNLSVMSTQQWILIDRIVPYEENGYFRHNFYQGQLVDYLYNLVHPLTQGRTTAMSCDFWAIKKKYVPPARLECIDF